MQVSSEESRVRARHQRQGSSAPDSISASSPAARTAQLVAWIALPLALATWVAIDRDRFYPVWDEWVIVDRAHSGFPLHEMFVGFNGHLWTLTYWVYHAQVNWFGLENNSFVFLVLTASLVALQLSIAAVLVRLGVPTVVALLLGGIAACFGPGSENMVFELQFATNFALALCITAGFVALGKRTDRTAAIVIAGLLVAAVAVDSGIAAVGSIFAGVIVVWLWPRRLATLALIPPIAAHLTWLLVDHSEVLVTEPCQNCTSVTFTPPWGWGARFALELLLRGAGGLVGGRQLAGVLVLAIAILIVVAGLLRRQLARPVVVTFTAGSLAALATAVSTSYSRAGFWSSAEQAIDTLGGPGNRYVHPVAVFLVLGFAPAIASLVRPHAGRAAGIITVAIAAGLVVVFALNLDRVDSTRDFYEGWSASVEARVREAVTVLHDGCAPGREPDPSALPAEDESFQITVALLQGLLDDGALTPDFGRKPTSETRRAICRPS